MKQVLKTSLILSILVLIYGVMSEQVRLGDRWWAYDPALDTLRLPSDEFEYVGRTHIGDHICFLQCGTFYSVDEYKAMPGLDFEAQCEAVRLSLEAKLTDFKVGNSAVAEYLREFLCNFSGTLADHKICIAAEVEDLARGGYSTDNDFVTISARSCS